MGSNVGQVALNVVGVALTAYTGNPAWMAAASTVGQVAFPTDLGTVTGPRLADLKTQTTEVGAVIPVVYGSYVVAGNVIWSQGLAEQVKKKKVGGKGGPTQKVKTYSYTINAAVGICEGQVSELVRVWADAVTIYDARPQQANETDAQYALRLEANVRTGSFMTWYDGAEDQLPDFWLEFYEGAGKISAFRGLSYMVFHGFDVAPYGNRMPNFRFQVQRCPGGV
jgi:hypothetical protein